MVSFATSATVRNNNIIHGNRHTTQKRSTEVIGASFGGGQGENAPWFWKRKKCLK